MTNYNLSVNYNKLFIGINLKRLRESYKLSQTEVAKIIGKTQQAYDLYERGERDISVPDLITLGGFYNISLDLLVGNPFSNKSDHTLSFLSFEFNDPEVKETAPINISTVYDDVICYQKDELTYQFFWKTNANNEGHVMLFHYYDKMYVSKIYYNGKGGGHFYINNEPRYFNKAHAENILMRGVLMAELKKEFIIKNFFSPNS